MKTRAPNPIIEAIIEMGDNTALPKAEVHDKMFKAYNDYGKWINEPDKDGITPLIHAVNCVNQFAVEWLLDSEKHDGAHVDINYQIKNKDLRFSALNYAVRNKDEDLGSLKEEYKSTPKRNILIQLLDHPQLNNHSRLHAVGRAAASGNLRYINYIFSEGKKFLGDDGVSRATEWAVYEAVRNNQVEALRLLSKLVNLTMVENPSGRGRHVIDEAIANGYVEAAKILIASKCYVADDKAKSLTECLLQAILNGKVSLPDAQSLLASCLNLEDKKYVTREILGIAFEIGDEKIIKLLINRNDNCLKGNYKGKSAILQAAQIGNVNLLDNLMRSDPEYKINEKSSVFGSSLESPALKVAASFGRIEAVIFLLGKGAKFNYDQKGKEFFWIHRDKDADILDHQRVNNVLYFTYSKELNSRYLESAFRMIDARDREAVANLYKSNKEFYAFLMKLIPENIPASIIVKDAIASVPPQPSESLSTSSEILMELKQAEGESTTLPSAPMYELEGIEPGAISFDDERKSEERKTPERSEVMPLSATPTPPDPNLAQWLSMLKMMTTVESVWKTEGGEALRESLKQYADKAMLEQAPSQQESRSSSLRRT